MNKWEIRAAAYVLLIFLPIFLSAQGAVSGEPKYSPERYFTLSIYETPSSPAIPARALSPPPLPSTPPPEIFTFRSLTRDFLKDAGEIWSYPFHIQTRDILPIAVLAALTGVMINNDEAIYKAFFDFRTGHAWVKSLSPVITQLGSVGAWAAAAAFLTVGLLAKDDKAVETAALVSSAMLQSAILVTFLKGLFGRQRPSWAGEDDRWSGPVGFTGWFETGISAKYDSFPGGHAITAFSLATVVAMQYQETVWVPVVSYATAAGAALSRLTEGKHWLSDCLVGSVLGYVIGRMVVLNHRHRFRIAPTAGVDHRKFSLAIAVSLR